MNAHDTDEVTEVIDIDLAPVDSNIAPIELPQTVQPEEPSNPDAWLQWALVIGLLALFLICALLILVAWNGR